MDTIGFCSCGFENGWEFQAKFRFPEGSEKFDSPCEIFDLINCESLPWQQLVVPDVDEFDPGRLLASGSIFRNAYTRLTRDFKAGSQITIEMSQTLFGEEPAIPFNADGSVQHAWDSQEHRMEALFLELAPRAGNGLVEPNAFGPNRNQWLQDRNVRVMTDTGIGLGNAPGVVIVRPLLTVRLSRFFRGAGHTETEGVLESYLRSQGVPPLTQDWINIGYQIDELGRRVQDELPWTRPGFGNSPPVSSPGARSYRVRFASPGAVVTVRGTVIEPDE